MKREHDLGQLDWMLTGHTPYLWKLERLGAPPGVAGPTTVDVPAIPARVPGSVQASLRDAGVIPDWQVGKNARACEWVENRHWIYRTDIPDEWLAPGLTFRLNCRGLDYSGWVLVNGREAAAFRGTHVPHVVDVTPHLQECGNVLEIVFDLPPRWLGQFGYSSRMTEWKTRYNYTWDWVYRLVQIGIWKSITLDVSDGNEIQGFRCASDVEVSTGKGQLVLHGHAVGEAATRLRVHLSRDGRAVAGAAFAASELERGITWEGFPVELWWPNLMGGRPLYELTCELADDRGVELDRLTRTVGFKHVTWEPCQDAPPEADPWICVVNGQRLFIQGVNFAPIRANFADLTREDYAERLAIYRDLGCNMLRVNACGFLEHSCFYELCDEFGLMVWQEFPLTSSGLENWPPEEQASIDALAEIAESFIRERQHHVSLTMWSGGNELQGDLAGRKTGGGKPCDLTHPMLKRLVKVVDTLDPTRRCIPVSPCGPRATANPAEFGKGLHWDVHGPYQGHTSRDEAREYWARDDALFRAELCCAGANPIETTEQYRGDYPLLPATVENEYWAFPTSWWVDWDVQVKLRGREPEDLEEYVAWSQEYQAWTLALAVKSCKDRFPRCGGVLLWGSHDTISMPTNASILDYHGNLKPAAVALGRIWRGTVNGGDGA